MENSIRDTVLPGKEVSLQTYSEREKILGNGERT